MTEIKRTNRQLAELIVDTLAKMEHARSGSGLYPAAEEIRRVCSFGLPLADMLVKGMIRSLAADGREEMDNTWTFLLTQVPADRVASLGIDHAEWLAANDDAEDVRVWWAAYGAEMPDNPKPHEHMKFQRAAEIVAHHAVAGHRSARSRARA